MKTKYKELNIKDFNNSFFKTISYFKINTFDENSLLLNYFIFSYDDDIAWGVHDKNEKLEKVFRDYTDYLFVVYNYLSPYTHLNILRYLELYHK